MMTSYLAVLAISRALPQLFLFTNDTISGAHLGGGGGGGRRRRSKAVARGGK